MTYQEVIAALSATTHARRECWHEMVTLRLKNGDGNLVIHYASDNEETLFVPDDGLGTQHPARHANRDLDPMTCGDVDATDWVLVQTL